MILEEQTLSDLGKTFEEANQRSEITCQCDYCGKVFKRLKHNILRSWKYTKNDSCPERACVQKKRVDSNRKIFGTDNVFQNEDVKEIAS